MIFDFIKDLFNRCLNHKIFRAAAALSYYLFFSFFPFLVFLSSLLSKLNISKTNFYSRISIILPSDIVSLMDSYLSNIGNVSSNTLLVFGVAFTLYIPFRAFSFLVSYIYENSEGESSRPIFINYIFSFFFSFIMYIIVIFTLFFATIGETILNFFDSYLHISKYFNIDSYISSRFIVLAIIIVIIISFLYKVAPKGKLKISQYFPGALVTTFGWIIVSKLFSIYVENFGRYTNLYGSLGAIIVLLVWLHMISTVILLGSEFNQSIIQIRKGYSKGEAQ